jgi:fructosamine-3-kinase
MSDVAWRSRVHGLLMRAPDQALLVQFDQRWSLPVVEVETFSDEDLRLASSAFQELLGTRVAILRFVARRVDQEQRLLEIVDVLEPLDSDWRSPPEARWIDRRSLADLPLANEEHRQVLLDTLDELASGAVPAQRAPWARQGWMADAVAWIHESLAELGRSPTGDVEQIKAWCLSSLLRVSTTDGTVFFKATADSPLFADEGNVMRELARLFPGHVPAPLAVDSQRRWMLLDDLGPELGWDAPPEVRGEVLRVFAGMQIESIGHADKLLGLGCVDRRLDVLATEARDLLADDSSLAGLDDEEAERARALGSNVDDLCAALAESRMPYTVLHGDLHLSNVARHGEKYVFFDWTDASVGHPLFDLIDVFREESEAIHDQLRDIYLSAWVGTEPMDRLREIWDLAQPLAFLHHAVSYRHIAAHVEPGSGHALEWALPYFLRKFLAAATRTR